MHHVYSYYGWNLDGDSDHPAHVWKFYSMLPSSAAYYAVIKAVITW